MQKIIKLCALCGSVVMYSAAFAQFNPSGPPPPPPPPVTVIENVSDPWGQRFFHLGLNFTTGIYWARPNSPNNSANGASFGYGYGANLEFYFTRNYGVVLGFEVANIGAKYINTIANPSTGFIDSTIAHNESLQYLEIPFELKMKTNPIGRIRYFGVVGLQAGFLLKAIDDYTAVVVPTFGITIYRRTDYSGNNADIYSQTDFFRLSLVIGLGAEYSIAGSSALQVSLTYNNCFTNMNNTSSNAVNLKGVELMVGVLF